MSNEMESTMMALSHKDKDRLTKGQQLAFRLWRWRNYHLSVNDKVPESLINSLPDIKIKESNPINEIKKHILINKIQNIILLTVDSCIPCKRDVVNDITIIKPMIQERLGLASCDLILLNTRIGHMENLYKLSNLPKYKQHYHKINWTALKKFINYYEHPPNSISVLKASIVQVHETLTKYENRYTQYNNGIINSINDITQIEITTYYANILNNFVNVIPIMYTNDIGSNSKQDLGMVHQCRKNDIMPINSRDIINYNIRKLQR